MLDVMAVNIEARELGFRFSEERSKVRESTVMSSGKPVRTQERAEQYT